MEYTTVADAVIEADISLNALLFVAEYKHAVPPHVISMLRSTNRASVTYRRWSASP
jgi:hypothetical protein